MSSVDNSIYSRLGDRWYRASDDPVALLRAESRLRNPWILERLEPSSKVLDIGCGGGFLSNELAAHGHEVTGLDAARDALAVAAAHDWTASVSYIEGDALALPFRDASFDAVTAMDFLEHVENPARVVEEVARVLRPGGSFFFHTFNRNPISWLVVIKGVEWFVKNTPPNMHVYRLFVKPDELYEMCACSRLRVTEIVGSRPKLSHILPLVLSGIARPDFAFVWSKNLLTGYTGVATKTL
jgi:2-polyprenyl-6-hydroxyphenyl methylase / 3-demethylubiquinone-9 3-methyltransferase